VKDDNRGDIGGAFRCSAYTLPCSVSLPIFYRLCSDHVGYVDAWTDGSRNRALFLPLTGSAATVTITITITIFAAGVGEVIGGAIGAFAGFMFMI